MRIAIILLCIIPSICHGQVLETDLYGFRLKQYREVIANELGTPIQKAEYDDGYEQEIYLVEKDTSVYMVFEFAKSELQTIWSVQLTGTKKEFDCGFKGLTLGMTENEIKSILGKPSSIRDIGEYGYEWKYEDTNYSLEISPSGLFSSIKINNTSSELFPEPDIRKIPRFNEFRKILESNDRVLISNILAPDIEINKNDSIFYFQNSIRSEIESDKSGIFKLVKEMGNITKNTNPGDTLQYEENMRMTEYAGVLHVAKFRSAGQYSEIVFKYIFGKYLIWEIKLN